MSKVTIYQFQKYNISTDEKRKSSRWATLEAIALIGGEPLINTATEVEASAVDTDIPGMTDRGFDPYKRSGFQRVVTA